MSKKRSKDNHQRLGRALDALVAPVGTAWAQAHRERPDLQLWAGDRYHPSEIGSYLTACVFFAVLYGHTVLGNSFLDDIPPPDAAVLQRAADAAYPQQ